MGVSREYYVGAFWSRLGACYGLDSIHVFSYLGSLRIECELSILAPPRHIMKI